MLESGAVSAAVAGCHIRQQIGARRRFEVGDPLAQNRDEVAHDMHDRPLDTEQVSVQVALTHAVADLAGQADVQLIFRDCVQLGATFVGTRVVGVERHVDRLRRQRHLVDALPGPLKVWPARLDHAHLRVGVARALVLAQVLGEWILQRGLWQAISPPKDRLHRPLVLIDCVQAGDKIAHQEPGDETDDDSNCSHCSCLSLLTVLCDTTIYSGTLLPFVQAP